MNIKAAIFDMDGTLIDSLMFWDIMWGVLGENFLGDKNFRPTKRDDQTVRTVTLIEAVQIIHDHYKIGDNPQQLLDLVNEMIKQFYSTTVKLKPGVKEFLEYLKSKGTKICLASATAFDLLEIALRHCQIESYFDRCFSCATIGKGKEEPDIYLLAQEYLGTKFEDTWVFEDSLTAIKTATKIGMPTVGIYDRYNFEQKKIQEIATEYIGPSESLLKLVK